MRQKKINTRSTPELQSTRPRPQKIDAFPPLWLPGRQHTNGMLMHTLEWDRSIPRESSGIFSAQCERQLPIATTSNLRFSSWSTKKKIQSNKQPPSSPSHPEHHQPLLHHNPLLLTYLSWHKWAQKLVEAHRFKGFDPQPNELCLAPPL